MSTSATKKSLPPLHPITRPYVDEQERTLNEENDPLAPLPPVQPNMALIKFDTADNEKDPKTAIALFENFINEFAKNEEYTYSKTLTLRAYVRLAKLHFDQKNYGNTEDVIKEYHQRFTKYNTPHTTFFEDPSISDIEKSLRTIRSQQTIPVSSAVILKASQPPQPQVILRDPHKEKIKPPQKTSEVKLENPQPPKPKEMLRNPPKEENNHVDDNTLTCPGPIPNRI